MGGLLGMKALLTCGEVCQLLHVSPATLSRMVASNRIPYVLMSSGKTKKTVRFSEAELERWIERRSRGAVPPVKQSIEESRQGQPIASANGVSRRGAVSEGETNA